MTEPVTSNKGYTIPNTGDLVNAWGGTLNGNFSLIDSNISANTSVALSSGTVTLSSSQAQNLAIKLSGSLSGACTVQVPQKPSFFLFQNGTTANGYVVTVSTGASGGATVGLPASGTFPIYTDGTNCYGVAFSGQLNLQGPGNNTPTLAVNDSGSGYGAGIQFTGYTGNQVILTGPTAGAGLLALYSGGYGSLLFHIDTAGSAYATNLVAGGYVQIGGSGAAWSQGNGAPASGTPGGQTVGSLYSNTGGSSGSILYVCTGGGTWKAIA